MRTSCVRMFIIFVGFFGIATAAHGELFRLLEEGRRDEERLRLHLKYTDFLTWSWDLSLSREMASDRIAKALESRAVVTRKQNAKMPKWDGGQPAFIVSPMLWYFDPESRVQKMNLSLTAIWVPGADDIIANGKDRMPKRLSLWGFATEGLECQQWEHQQLFNWYCNFR